jgi:uncharacterized protein (TIGR03067 family)
MTPIFLGIAIVLGAPTVKDPPKKDPPSIVGEWVLESMTLAGMAVPAPEAAKLTFTKEGKCVSVDKAGGKPDESSYTVDSKKEPKEIDIKESAGMRDMTMSGIYKIEGDTLTICLAIMGERPKALAVNDKNSILIVLKRVKKD